MANASARYGVAMVLLNTNRSDAVPMRRCRPTAELHVYLQTKKRTLIHSQTTRCARRQSASQFSIHSSSSPSSCEAVTSHTPAPGVATTAGQRGTEQPRPPQPSSPTRASFTAVTKASGARGRIHHTRTAARIGRVPPQGLQISARPRPPTGRPPAGSTAAPPAR